MTRSPKPLRAPSLLGLRPTHGRTIAKAAAAAITARNTHDATCSLPSLPLSSLPARRDRCGHPGTVPTHTRRPSVHPKCTCSCHRRHRTRDPYAIRFHRCRCRLPLLPSPKSQRVCRPRRRFRMPQNAQVGTAGSVPRQRPVASVQVVSRKVKALVLRAPEYASGSPTSPQVNQLLPRHSRARSGRTEAQSGSSTQAADAGGQLTTFENIPCDAAQE